MKFFLQTNVKREFSQSQKLLFGVFVSVAACCYSDFMKEKRCLSPHVSSCEIGKRIRQRRRELHISQEQLAEMLNVSFQQIQRYECGTNKLNVENMQVIARLLDISPAELFELKADQGDGAGAVHDATVEWGNPDEQELLRRFRQIDKKNRKAILAVIKMAAQGCTTQTKKP